VAYTGRQLEQHSSHFTEAQLVDSRSVKRAMTPPLCQRSIEWIEGDVVGAGHSSAAPGLANRWQINWAQPPKSEIKNWVGGRSLPTVPFVCCTLTEQHC
jgi:hypothetical protein